MEVDELDVEESFRKSHPRPPPLRPQCITAPPQLSQLAPAMAHSPAPPAASAPLDSPLASAASAPFNTLPPPAASGESRVSSAALHRSMPSTQGGYIQLDWRGLPEIYGDGAPKPWKEVNTKMYWDDALTPRKSQCKKDPGDVYARCCLARCIPQPPGLTSVLVSEVKPAPLVVCWRGIAGKRRQSPCASARYTPPVDRDI